MIINKNFRYLQYLNLNNKLHHSYLIFDKIIERAYKFSQLITASFLCNNNYLKRCKKCISCELFSKNIHPDYYSINSIIKDNIQLEEIKNIILKIEKKPTISKKNIILINLSNLMTDKAANCLLKILEEPPLNTIFLLTTNNNNLLSTISSRCIFININKHIELIKSKKTAKFMYKIFFYNNYKFNFVKIYLLSIKNDNIHLILDTIWFIFARIMKYKYLILNENKKKLFNIALNFNNHQILKIFNFMNYIITIKYLRQKHHNINIYFFINYMIYSLYEN